EERVGLDKVREMMTSDDGFDAVQWKEMAEMGWLGLVVAEAHGGSGLRPIEMSVLLEEMGRLVTPGPFFASAVLATTLIQQLATPEQQADLLPSLASGESIGAVAVFESARRWAIDGEITRAIRDGESWVLTGSKRAVLG